MIKCYLSVFYCRGRSWRNVQQNTLKTWKGRFPNGLQISARSDLIMQLCFLQTCFSSTTVRCQHVCNERVDLSLQLNKCLQVAWSPPSTLLKIYLDFTLFSVFISFFGQIHHWVIEIRKRCFFISCLHGEVRTLKCGRSWRIKHGHKHAKLLGQLCLE